MKSFIPETQEAVITEYAMSSESTDVLQMANELMADASIRFHAPEHHYLIAATLIAAYCNATGLKDEKKERLGQILHRTQIISPGSCGFYGVCGNVLAIGAVFSQLLNSTPLTVTELQLVNQAAAEAQQIMTSYPGPRCCKRATYRNLATGVACINRLMCTRLEYPEKVACSFFESNETCSKNGCPFYPAPGQEHFA